MRKFLNAWAHAARETEWFWGYDPDETIECPTVVGCAILVAWWETKHRVQSWFCLWLGCDVECDDWSGPESGGIAGHCARCGWRFSHTFY